MKEYEKLLEFWFDPKHLDLHFVEDPAFDEKIRENFLSVWEKGKEGLLVSWRESLRGRLAEIIVLDQFSRNLFREDIRTYTQDKMAIALAQEALAHEEYGELSPVEKRYILLPFMHSESLELHDWARPYFESVGDENTLYFEKLHYDVLLEFGRYPYQNQDLGRESTAEEKKVLQERGDGFYR